MLYALKDIRRNRMINRKFLASDSFLGTIWCDFLLINEDVDLPMIRFTLLVMYNFLNIPQQNFNKLTLTKKKTEIFSGNNESLRCSLHSIFVIPYQFQWLSILFIYLLIWNVSNYFTDSKNAEKKRKRNP